MDEEHYCIKILAVRGKRKTHIFLDLDTILKWYKKTNNKGFSIHFFIQFNMGFQNTQTLPQLLQWDAESLGGGCIFSSNLIVESLQQVLKKRGFPHYLYHQMWVTSMHLLCRKAKKIVVEDNAKGSEALKLVSLMGH